MLSTDNINLRRRKVDWKVDCMKLDVGAGSDPYTDDCAIVDLGAEGRYGWRGTKHEGLYVAADGEQLPFKDESFEEVHSSCCVMVYTDESAIREMWRVLKVGGRMKLHVYLNVLDDTLKAISILESEFKNTYTLKVEAHNMGRGPLACGEECMYIYSVMIEVLKVEADEHHEDGGLYELSYSRDCWDTEFRK